MDTVLIYFLVAFSLCILQGNLDVFWYDSHMLGMYGVEVRWYHFLLCFPFVSSPQTLPKQHIITLLFSISSFIISFPMLHCIPIFSSSFHVSATQINMVTIFVLMNLWSLVFLPSGQYQCFIYLIFFSSWHISFTLTSCFFSFSVYTLFAVPTSSSTSSLFWWTCDLWDLHTSNIVCHSFIPSFYHCSSCRVHGITLV